MCVCERERERETLCVCVCGYGYWLLIKVISGSEPFNNFISLSSVNVLYLHLQIALSPKRPDGKKQQQQSEQQSEQQSAEKKFLAGSHAIKPLASVQKYTPKSPSSSNFDESWPDSERPSSPRLERFLCSWINHNSDR